METAVFISMDTAMNMCSVAESTPEVERAEVRTKFERSCMKGYVIAVFFECGVTQFMSEDYAERLGA